MSLKSPKYAPPRVSGALRRPRLVDALARSRDKRALLIVGQAAQGKSTVGAQYIQQSAEPAAWINIGPEDFDSAGLCRTLAAAVFDALDQPGLLEQIEAAMVSFGPREKRPMYREWARAIYRAADRPFEVVLDALERLPAGAPAFELIETLVQEAPEGVRFILLSRTTPPLEIERLEMVGAAEVLTGADLAFNAEEIQSYFRNQVGRSAPPKQVRRLLDLTEGWTGGLVLLTDFLARTDTTLAKVFENGLLSHYQHKVFAYFAEQAFESESEETKQFLVQTSVFEVFDAGIAAALTQISSAESILKDLVKRNLFIVSHPGRAGRWSYRYHLLFRDFLQAKLDAEWPAEGRREIMVQAGELLERARGPEEAIRLYLAAEAHDRAAGAIKTLGRDWIRAGRADDMIPWLDALPRQLLETDPWLALYWCRTRRFSHLIEKKRLLKKIHPLLIQRQDQRGLLLATALTIEFSLYLGRFENERLTEAERLLAGMAPDEHSLEQAELWLQYGFCQVLRGNVAKGVHACDQAYTIASAENLTGIRITALIHGFIGRLNLADHDGMRRCTREAERLGVSEHPESRLLFGINLALYYVYCEGEAEKGAAFLDELLREIQSHGLHYLLMPAIFHQVICLIYAGKFQEAFFTAERAITECRRIGDRYMETLITIFLGVGRYRAGDFDQAVDILDRAWTMLQIEARVDTHHHNMEIARQMAKLAAGRPADPDPLVEALAFFQTNQSRSLTAEAQLALARLYQEWDQPEKAGPLLESGLKMVAEKGFEPFLMLTPRDAVKASRLALALCDPPASETAARILAERHPDRAQKELEPYWNAKNRKLRGRCRDVLTRLHLAERPVVRIELLGGFRVRRGEHAVKTEGWGGVQPQNLLKALLSIGGRQASRDELMDALWPDSPPQAAERNFKVALHRLRKVLEPDLDPKFGSSYLVLKENTLTLTDLVEETDVEAFQRLVREGRRLETQGRLRDAAAAYGRADALYGGEYLPDCSYQTWCLDQRRALVERLIEMLFWKARLHESRGGHRKAAAAYRRVIDADPVNEEAFRRLMLLNFDRGRFDAAVKAYRQCRENMARHLDLPPSPGTRAVYQKIVDASSD